MCPGPALSKKPMRVHFPGPALAREIEDAWALNEGGRPLKLVIGDTFEAGSAAYFAQSRPSVRIDDDAAKSPWAPDGLKKAAGAVIVWSVDKEGAALPPRYAVQNPTARVVEIVALPYQTRARLAPARLGIAIVPPAAP